MSRERSPGRVREFRRVNLAAFFGFVVILVATVVLAGVQLRGVYGEVDRVVHHHNLKTAIATEMQMAGMERRDSLYRMLLLEDPFERDVMMMRHHGAAYRIGAGRQRLMEFFMDADERRLFDEQGALIEQVVATQERLVDLVFHERMDEAIRLMLDEAMPLQARVHASFEEMRQQQTIRTEQAMTAADTAYVNTLWLLGFAGIVALVGSVAIARLAYRRTHYIAIHDALTGLLTRAGFMDALEREIEQRRRSGGSFGVFYLDLDQFKPINDRYGHAEGDIILRSVADRLRQCVRRGDIVGRLGGDEFAVLVRDVRNEADCRVVAEKILEASTRPFVVRDREHRLETSIGLACYPADALSVDELMAAADHAMYTAKRDRSEVSV